MHQYNAERYKSMKMNPFYTKNLFQFKIGKAIAELPKQSLDLRALTNLIQNENEYLDIRSDFMKKIQEDKK